MLTTRQAAPDTERHGAGGGSQGVVTAAADVVAGVEVGTALAHDDLAGRDDLTAVALHQPLGVGVAPRSARTRRPYL